jgi:alpha-N-arabinofuranosidase
MQARLIVNPAFSLGSVDPRLYGGFAEHLGRCIYGGLYEPGHPGADDMGFRTDVLELLRELRMPVVRYPGGNFVSGYRWEDGIGPRANRPRRLDLAWKSTETNQFGSDEFCAWCRRLGAAPMLAVNLGTRGPQDAANLVEYCNHAGGSLWSDRRRANGWEAPHAVKLWCLGNEMDGPWQIGHKTAEEYGRVACEAAKLMKWTDPGIELVVCGSSHRGMPTFGAWEATVLEHTFDHVEYLSIHTYFGNAEGDSANFLAKPETMGRFIDEVVACCDYVAARRRSPKRILLSFDEWNVWYHSHGDRERRGIRDWDVAPPLLEDVYTMADALVVGGMLIALVNHADRVRIGCLAQIVNVIAAVMTEDRGPAWRQTIYWPLYHASRLARGTVLRPVVDCPTYACRDVQKAPYLACAAVLDPASEALTLLAVNRHLTEACELRTELQGFAPFTELAWTVLRDDDLQAANSAAAPNRIAPQPVTGASLNSGTLVAPLPPASWNVLHLRRAP